MICWFLDFSWLGLLRDLVILVIPGLLRVSVCFGWLCFGGFLVLLRAVGSKCLWICLPRLWFWCLCGLVLVCEYLVVLGWLWV